MFRRLSEFRNDTGLIFGLPGNPYLSVAIMRASDNGRRVGVISAANVAALKPFEDQIEGVIPINGSNELNAVITALSDPNNGIDAVVLHGLSEYVQQVLAGICGTETPTQAQWGEMARKVSNDILRLTAVAPVCFVTCDVILDEEENKPRLNINPGLQKLILGYLVSKIYVGQRLGADGEIEVVMQENPALAMQFQLPRRERSADGEKSPAAASLGNGGKHRRLR